MKSDHTLKFFPFKLNSDCCSESTEGYFHKCNNLGSKYAIISARYFIKAILSIGVKRKFDKNRFYFSIFLIRISKNEDMKNFPF